MRQCVVLQVGTDVTQEHSVFISYPEDGKQPV